AANRLSRTPRPIVRTRHIAHAVRAHAANRWLYRRATAWVVTVTDAIRGQYIASGLLEPERVTALPGGVDTEAYRPLPADPAIRRRLGTAPALRLRRARRDGALDPRGDPDCGPRGPVHRRGIRGRSA